MNSSLIPVRSDRDDIDELLAPLHEFSIDYTVEFLWTRNWRKSIATASDRYGCDTIMLCESSAEHKVGLTDSRWELVRLLRTFPRGIE